MNWPEKPEPRRVPAANGMAWVMQTMGLLRLQAGRLLLMALLMQLVLGLTQLPLVGLLIVMSVPGFTAGLLEAIHRAAQGGRPELRMLFGPLTTRPQNGRLWALGALVFAVGVISMSFLMTSSGELTDPELMKQIEQGNLDALTSLNQQALAQMALAFLVGISVSGTISYFAIPLIWFRQVKLGNALLTGLRALVVNWRAFLVLSLGLLLVFVPVAIISGSLFSLAASGGFMTAIVMGLIMLLLLLFQLMLFGTQYCAFRDIFGLAIDAVPTTENDSQLVA